MEPTKDISDVTYFRSGDTAWKVVDGVLSEIDWRTAPEEDIDATYPFFRDFDGYWLDEAGRRVADRIDPLCDFCKLRTGAVTYSSDEPEDEGVICSTCLDERTRRSLEEPATPPVRAR
jgi:hypothetical protein